MPQFGFAWSLPIFCIILTYIWLNTMCIYFPVWAYLKSHSPFSITHSCPVSLKFTSGSYYECTVLTSNWTFSVEALILQCVIVCVQSCCVQPMSCCHYQTHPPWWLDSFLKPAWILIPKADPTPLPYSGAPE